MKKKVFLFIFLIISIFIGNLEIKALEVSELNPTIKVGETKDIELYANTGENTKKLDFSLVYLSYDVIGNFESELGTVKRAGSTYSISFDNPVNGRVKLGTIKITVSNDATITSGTINLYNATSTSADEIKTKLNNQNIKVNIDNAAIIETPPTNLLKEIKSDIVNIKLEKNKYEYEITVDNDIDKLDLTAIPIDNTYNVEISNQNLKEGKNVITINVTKEDITEKYTINVTKEKKVEAEKKEQQSTITKEERKGNKNYKSGWIIVMIVLSGFFTLGLILLKKNK